MAPNSSLEKLPLGLARLALLLSLLFVVYQWHYSGGYPYIRDGNESALSFVHALNLKHFNPFETGFLTTYDTEFDKTSANPNFVYTLNPNFPRYVHYALLLAGIDSFTTQVLIITFSLTILNVLSLKWLLTELLGASPYARWISLVPLFATVFDYWGFLSFTVNTYRTFCFCLLWLSFLAVLKPWSFARVFAIFFILCQLEYGFALFVVGSSLALWTITSRPGGLRTLGGVLSGTFASLLLFLVQLRSLYPFAVIWHDFQSTSQRRGGGNLSSYFAEALPAILSRLQTINLPLQNLLLVWALVSSVVCLWRKTRWFSENHPDIRHVRLVLSKLFLSLLVGALVGSIAMTNYFTEAFFGSILPFLTFFNVIASAIFVSDVLALAFRLPGFHGSLRLGTAAVAGVLSLAPLLCNSFKWWRDYPGLKGDYVRILKEHYFKKPILVMGHFNQVPTALTWGPTLQMNDSESAIVGSDFSRFERFRDENGNLVFLCLNLKWVGFEALIAKLQSAGYEILQRGSDFAFIRVKGPEYLTSAASVAAPDTAFGAVRVRLVLPVMTGDAREPLLACGGDGSGNLVYLQHVGADMIRVGLDAGPRGALASPPFKIDPGREQVVEISHGSLYPPPSHPRMQTLARSLENSLRRVVRILWNNEPVIEADLPLPPINHQAVRVGEAAGFPGTAERFEGKILSVERHWPESFVPYDRLSKTPGAQFGPLSFEVRFSRGVAGRSEPLVTSGLTGAGDFLYVRNLDDRHIQYGFDHWGVKGFIGEPIEMEPDHWYRLTLSMGSLYPPRNDPWFAGQASAAVQAAKNSVLVLMEDRIVLSADSPAYESPAPFVQVGENGIGGSTTGPAFSGSIRNVTRLPFDHFPYAKHRR